MEVSERKAGHHTDLGRSPSRPDRPLRAHMVASWSFVHLNLPPAPTRPPSSRLPLSSSPFLRHYFFARITAPRSGSASFLCLLCCCYCVVHLYWNWNKSEPCPSSDGPCPTRALLLRLALPDLPRTLLPLLLHLHSLLRLYLPLPSLRLLQGLPPFPP
ncbi:hypothetical protein PENSPDRAFT_83466 [Peniophora sp. CONT]|nr:hypothetical protein PENSPDRAFT_83466 [Peniophora sp. CONT]